MSYETLIPLAKTYPAVPITLQYPQADFDSLAVLNRLQNQGQQAVLLRSADAGTTLIAAAITASYTYRAGQLTTQSAGTTTTTTTPLAPVIDALLAAHRTPRLASLPVFTGGIAGYFSYEYAQYAKQHLELTAADPYQLPDADLFMVPTVIAYERDLHRVTLSHILPSKDLTAKSYASVQADLATLREQITNGAAVMRPKPLTFTSPLSMTYDEATFEQRVRQAQAHIVAGDIFQLIMANQQHATITGDLRSRASSLFAANPTPYQFYFQHGAYEALGASPETLIKRNGDRLFTYPLAGTRRRGRTAAEDQALADELQHSEKELSEHNMLIDLGRNDLGAVSTFGSVAVTRTRALLKFANVMHLGSVVESTARPDATAMAIIDSLLPAGTLSGAPKQRAMSLIDELEPTKRGLYGGALGYFDFNGDLDFAIGIRLCFRQGPHLLLQSGAGIVADSQPRLEYKEFNNKISGVKNALEAQR
ncbi:anthranilate synthase component I family protein [Lacticaseibacillus baoqingensis]|uniref:Anthranilate synthase component 1 n=1 Tax=Lacticaseibacillus baoqingensis TaxID=2486013 RepID=A0ABW4E6S7_9LACO|nr:chorismate-binding protein [Lacticaseibacillus baoqingensis]